MLHIFTNYLYVKNINDALNNPEIPSEDILRRGLPEDIAKNLFSIIKLFLRNRLEKYRCTDIIDNEE